MLATRFVLVVAFRWLALLAGAAAASGCTYSAEHWLALDQVPPAAEVHAQLVQASPYGIAADEDVLALTPEIRNYLAATLGRYGPRERLRKLGEMFARNGELALTYDQEVTRPASGVFATRRGNCLSFTQLFIAMARELGIHARFQEARSVGTWTRLGDVLLINRHITAWGFVTGATFEADFGDFDLDASASRQLVSDARARAQYFNNLGAESVARGDSRAGVTYLNRALTIDADLSYVWTNLGTALRHLGRADDAELAFRHALRLDANSLPALNGIARIEEARGNRRGAEAIGRLAARLNARNPYLQYANAQAAMASGDYERAVAALQSAIRLNPAEPDFRFELGRAWLTLGNVPRALKEFDALRAMLADPDQDRVYSERLRRIVASLPGLVPLPGSGPAPGAAPAPAAAGDTGAPAADGEERGTPAQAPGDAPARATQAPAAQPSTPSASARRGRGPLPTGVTAHA